jgi:hypothetical protein
MQFQSLPGFGGLCGTRVGSSNNINGLVWVLRACAFVLHTSTNFAEAVTQGKRLNDFISMACDLRVSPSMHMIAPMLAERKKKIRQ